MFFLFVCMEPHLFEPISYPRLCMEVSPLAGFRGTEAVTEIKPVWGICNTIVCTLYFCYSPIVCLKKIENPRHLSLSFVAYYYNYAFFNYIFHK